MVNSLVFLRGCFWGKENYRKNPDRGEMGKSQSLDQRSVKSTSCGFPTKIGASFQHHEPAVRNPTNQRQGEVMKIVEKKDPPIFRCKLAFQFEKPI